MGCTGKVSTALLLERDHRGVLCGHTLRWLGGTASGGWPHQCLGPPSRYHCEPGAGQYLVGSAGCCWRLPLPSFLDEEPEPCCQDPCCQDPCCQDPRVSHDADPDE